MKIKLHELRRLIPLLAESEENEVVLKRWAKFGDDIIDRKLTRIGIIPIYRGDNSSSVFAAGSSNTAREVLYKGKRAVVRLSTTSDSETSSFLRFLSFKDRMDPKYSKHFPKLFGTFEITIPVPAKPEEPRNANDYGYDEDGDMPPESNHGVDYGADDEVTENMDVDGVVVVVLEPLPSALVADIEFVAPGGRGFSPHKIPVNRLTRINEKGIHKAARMATKTTKQPERFDEIVEWLGSKFVPALLKLIDSTSIDKIDRILVDPIREEDECKYYAAWNLLGEMFKATIPTYDDAGDNEEIAMSHPSSSIREFYEFLRALSKAGMSWSDLHSQNFMMRPSTKDIVVVDPGAFYRTADVRPSW